MTKLEELQLQIEKNLLALCQDLKKQRDEALSTALELREAFQDLYLVMCGLEHLAGHSTETQEQADTIRGHIHKITVRSVLRITREAEEKYDALYERMKKVGPAFILKGVEESDVETEIILRAPTKAEQQASE